MTGVAERRIEYVPLDTIARAPRNPKRHDTDGIRRSVDRFGLAEVPAVDERTGRLVAGHGRLDDLVSRRANGQDAPDGVRVTADGDWLVPVLAGWASRSDAEAEAYLVASNQLNAKAGWDQQGLGELLADLRNVDPDLAEVTGFSAAELEDMLRANEAPDLDEFADDLRDPAVSDGWPVVKVKVPHHVAAAWDSHLGAHGEDEAAAFAKLLGVDPTPPALPAWDPVRPEWQG